MSKLTRADPTSTTLDQLEYSGYNLSIEDVEGIRDGKTYTTPSTQEASRMVNDPKITAAQSKITTPNRNVSGRYRSKGGAFELEIRLDVDGTRPLSTISGDFYQISGMTLTYFGSFIIDKVISTSTDSIVTLSGLGRYTWSAAAPNVRVIIQRKIVGQPLAPCEVQFFTTANQPGAIYDCLFVSTYFRTVQLEQDFESGVTPFLSYNTGSLASGGPSRLLSVVTAYAEAGIEFQLSTAGDIIATSEAGTDLMWSDSELHDAMMRHFSLWSDDPEWKVWLFAAYKHEDGPNLYGIMFDQNGKQQRQGSAT